MDELLRGAGLMEAWQSELQELLANLTSTARQSNSGTARRRKLFFQLQNCIDVCHDTNRVSYVTVVIIIIIIIITRMRIKAQPEGRLALQIIDTPFLHSATCGPKYTCNAAFRLTSCCSGKISTRGQYKVAKLRNRILL